MISNETPGFQPPEDAFDDVEGHGISSGRIEGPDTDDVEGHMPRVKVPLEGPDTDDVEGHALRRGLVEDVEGHARRMVDGTDADDVEGHMPRIRIIDGPDSDDVEGHMPLRKIVAEETGEGSSRPSGAPGRSI